MKPGFESEGFKNHIKSIGSVKLEKVINLISELNANIRDDDSLGYGFEIGHSYFCGKTEAMTDSHVRRVVKYDIIPTIQEYWFDNEKKAKEWSEKLIKVIND
jgi:5-methylcytosine-specific restriction protein B